MEGNQNEKTGTSSLRSALGRFRGRLRRRGQKARVLGSARLVRRREGHAEDRRIAGTSRGDPRADQAGAGKAEHRAEDHRVLRLYPAEHGSR